jgi:hypothetical protein
MNIEQRRSQIQDKHLTSRLGFATLLLVLLALSIASAAAQGSSADRADDALYDDLVLRRVETPNLVILDLLPVQDAYITSNRPDQNYGQASDLWVGYDLDRTGGGAQRTYIQWNIEDVPDYATINSAELWYNVFSVKPGGDASMTVNAYHLLSLWNGDSLTWTNAAGVDWGSISAEGAIPGAVGWGVLDVTALVKDWTSGGHANNGLVVLGDETVQERERGLHSSNVSDAQSPYLRINYTETADDIPPTATMVPFVPDLIGVDTFNVSWSGLDNPGGTGIDYYDVQFDADGDGLGWIKWLLHTTNTTATFVGESTAYQFRVRATDKSGNLSNWSAPESITVDTAPPVSIVLPFNPPIIQTSIFQVEWAGDDGPNGSGIQTYDVYSRRGNDGWILWLSQTTFTVEIFTAPNDASYSFEATAVDSLGNVELFTGIPEAAVIVDIDPPFVEPYALLPLIFQETN